MFPACRLRSRLLHHLPGLLWVGLALALLLISVFPVLAGGNAKAGKSNKPAAKVVKQPAKKAAAAFAFDDVVKRAQALARKPYVPPAPVPDLLMKMSYDAWRDIRFRPEKSLWRGAKLPFELQFFHPGLYFDRTVKINIVAGGKPRELHGTRDMFDYGKNTFAPQVPEEVGFAGFRVHAPIKTKDYYDEFLVFLGASYLRAVGRDQHYGLSARGLAVDTASADGEEFPWFREFWIVKPSPKDKSVQIYALLDSQRVCGAYSYKATPGKETVLEVKSVIFLRQPVEKLGIAPLTSMYFFGENTSPDKWDDYRPEVHDSDGLQVRFDSGEWLWRPLQNLSFLLLNSFDASNVRGFGLLQRDTDFDHYQDLEARYENRPSVWVEPQGDWGEGRLELVQIPTQDEIHDNIAAYWVPKNPAPPGQPMHFDYTMRWFDADQVRPPAGYTVATRVGTTAQKKQTKTFVVDFDGKLLRKLPPDAPVEAVVNVGAGATLVDQRAYRNPVNGTWRMAFQIKLDDTSKLGQVLPDKRSPVELRAFLRNGYDVVSETWSYAYKP